VRVDWYTFVCEEDTGNIYAENIGRHRKQFGRLGDQAPGIRACCIAVFTRPAPGSGESFDIHPIF
jgi:hypothetical protein